jgi:hypothetical protein
VVEISTPGSITLNGMVRANGQDAAIGSGGGGGSGGTVAITATALSGS